MTREKIKWYFIKATSIKIKTKKLKLDDDKKYYQQVFNEAYNFDFDSRNL